MDATRRLRCSRTALAAWLLGAWLVPQTASAQSAGATPPLIDASAPVLPEDSPPGDDTAESDRVKLYYWDATWDRVLKHLAEQTGSTLIMQKTPHGRFSRRDRTEYTRTEAVRIINRELEPLGFRVLEQGQHLIVLDLKLVAPRYLRPLTPTTPTQPSIPRTPEPLIPQPARERKFTAIATRTPPAEAEDANPVQQTAHALDEPAADGSLAEPAAPAPTVSKAMSIRYRPARDVARAIFNAFKSRAELVEQGPDGLPAFKVNRTPLEVHQLAEQPDARPSKRVEFSMGIDTTNEELVIEAAPALARDLQRLVRLLDHDRPAGAEGFRFVTSTADVGRIAERLQPQLQQVVRARQVAQQDQPAQPPVEPVPLPEGQRPAQEIGPGVLENLRGDVSVEALEELGVLILRGNEQDVQAVMEVIRQIEALSAGTTPEIHLLILQHMNSEAMATLLTEVYEQLATIRARGTTQTRAQAAFLPVVKPNALLIVAPDVEMEAILRLIEELDQPVDPAAEFEVFRLQNAPASQVVTTLTSLYEEREGLGTRVIVAADVRTNSVIVFAQPNDMREIAALIRKIDLQRTQAVTRMRIFPLRNAVADELAATITTAILSILSPPQAPTGQTGLGQVGAGITGQEMAPELRVAKSVILELLTLDGDQNKTVRSGILADVRVTADPRTNSLMVTAPEESLDLMALLIQQLDVPSPTVAEIKVFTLKNSDATATAQLLQALFAPQPTTGFGAQAQQALGVQIAGAEDASSGLVPMRFSVDPRTNSIIAVGGAEALRVVEAILLRLDESDVRQRKTTVVKLKNSPVIDVANAINQFLQSQRQLAQLDPNLVSNVELLEREVVAVPEPVTNSLLISATPRYYDEIIAMVQRLDEAPAQVVIQALLVEVDLQNTDEFGVELGFQDSVLFDRGVTTADDLLTIETTNTAPNGVQTTTQQIVSQSAQPGFLFNNQPLGNNISANPSDIGTQGLSNFSLGRVNGDLGFGGLVLSASSESVSVLIRALAARRNVHILSRPQIRTLDNQLAQIQVGQQVPIVNGVNIQPTGGAIPLIQQDQAGIILTVIPRISPDGTIVMETVAEKSQFRAGGVPIFTDATTGNTITSPIKDVITARTVVSVPNGQTIVLGGMITKTDDTIERKVPYLGDLPILGVPFRYDSTVTRRTELLIFLTPRVVRHDADSELMKEVEAGRLHFLESEAEAIHGPIFAVPPEVCPPEFAPLPSPFGEVPPAPGTLDDSSVPTTNMPAEPPSLYVPMTPDSSASIVPQSGTAVGPTPTAKRKWFR